MQSLCCLKSQGLYVELPGEWFKDVQTTNILYVTHLSGIQADISRTQLNNSNIDLVTQVNGAQRDDEAE